MNWLIIFAGWIVIGAWYFYCNRNQTRAFAARLEDERKHADKYAVSLRFEREQFRMMKGLDENMIERLLRINEQRLKENVACRALLYQYLRQVRIVDTAFDEIMAHHDPFYEICRKSVEQLVQIGNDLSPIGDMVTAMLRDFPMLVEYEGVRFEFKILINGSEDMRICWDIYSVKESSPHRATYENCGSWYNPFTAGRGLQGFLYLRENISTESDLADAICDCAVFLKKNNLVP